MTRHSSGPPSPSSAPRARAVRLLLAVLLVGLALPAVLWSTAATAPRPVEAPPGEFSAERAAALLDRLLGGEEVPRPAGSPAAAAMRERLVTYLGEQGFSVRVQRAVGAGPGGSVGWMHNVIAQRGSGRDRLALLAHYDSVGAGPGVSDDLAGVAALLEVARAAATDPNPPPLLLVLVEGEESGLVGAEAFVSQDPAFAEVAGVINLEARGTRGPSHMFQSGPGSAEWVRAWARLTRRPDASSLSAEVYRHMPNDTDFSLFLERGVPGLNFAFIGGVESYHTPLDDRAHLSLASLQHQGEQALAALRAFGDLSELEGGLPGGGEERVYATLGGRWLLSASRSSLRLVALLCALALLWAPERAVRAGWTDWGRVRGGVAWALLMPVGTAMLAGAYLGILRLVTGSAVPWRATPLACWVSLASLSLFAVAAVGGDAAGDGGVGRALGSWLLWGLAGLFTALFLPGASFLFVWPAVLLALCANGVRLRDAFPARVARIALVGLLVCLPLWMVVILGLAQAFGPPAGALILAALAFPLGLLGPLLAQAPSPRRLLAGGGAALAAAGFLSGFFLPTRTAALPERLNLVYLQDGEATRWQVWGFTSGLPAAFAEGGEWQEERDPERLPWAGRRTWSRPTPSLELPGPSYGVGEKGAGGEIPRAVWSGGLLHLSGILRSPSQAAHTTLEVEGPFELRALAVGRRDLEPASRLALIAPGSEGIRVELWLEPTGEATGEPTGEATGEPTGEAAGEPGGEGGTIEGDDAGREEAPLQLILVDRVQALPPAGGELLSLRGEDWVPSHDGDGAMLVTRLAVPIPPGP